MTSKAFAIHITLSDPEYTPQSFKFNGTRPQLMKALRRDLGLDGPTFYNLSKHGFAEIKNNDRTLRYEIEELK